MSIPNPLISSCKQEEVVLFIGAGLSLGAGLPGWDSLMKPLALELGNTWPQDPTFVTTDLLLQTARYYEVKNSRHTLIDYLRTKLDDSALDPTSVQRLLASFPAKVIVTTNFDSLIEKAFRKEGKASNVIIEDQELAFWKEDRTQILKICGDLNRPDSIAITKQDFTTFFSKRPRLCERLRSLLESKTALFLGYSLKDLFFNQIWDQIGIDFGQLQRQSYTVLFEEDTSEMDVADFEQRKIKPILLKSEPLDFTLRLQNWLEELIIDIRA